MDYKISLPVKLLYDLAVKFILWVKKNETKKNGEIKISKVIHQGKIFSCLNDYISDSITIKDMPEVLIKLAEQNIESNYIQNIKPFKNDKLPNDKKIKILINNTRISTFFVLTDGSNVLFHDRARTNEDLKILENERFDMFGAVSFENSTIKLKINDDKKFFDSKINLIKCMHGFAFEDTREPEDNLFGKQTVIMLGIILFLSEKDLNKASSTKTSIIEKFNLNNLPNSLLMTSKAKLAMDYLTNYNNTLERNSLP